MDVLGQRLSARGLAGRGLSGRQLEPDGEAASCGFGEGQAAGVSQNDGTGELGQAGCRRGIAGGSETVGFGLEHGERGLEAVGEIGGAPPRRIEQRFLAVEQGVDLFGERLDLVGKTAGEPSGAALAHGEHGAADILDRSKPEADLRPCGGSQHQGEAAKGRGELAHILAERRFDRRAVDGRCDAHAPLARRRFDQHQPFVRDQRRTARAGEFMAVIGAGLEDVGRQRQHLVPEQARAPGDPVLGDLDLPVETAERLAKARAWDPFVRPFHWTLVLLIAAAYLTGDEFDRVHELLGYSIVALLVERIVWGFVGSEHARFRDFGQAPTTVLAHTRDTIAGKARRYISHNPLGGVMVLLLIAGLLITAGTGWLMTVGGECHGLEQVHEVAANGMLLLIALHVAGVLFSSRAHGENLVRGMITGMKRAE